MVMCFGNAYDCMTSTVNVCVGIFESNTIAAVIHAAPPAVLEHFHSELH